MPVARQRRAFRRGAPYPPPAHAATPVHRQPRRRKVAVPKPKVKELRQIYRKLVTASAAYRINAMAEALQWYDAAIEFVVGLAPLTPELQKTYSRAIKSREQGISTPYEGEKETAFRTALSLYEKVCAPLNPPSIAAAYAVYESRKAKLEALQDRLTNKHGGLVKLLADVFKIDWAFVITDAEKPRKFHPDLKQIMYNRDHAEALKLSLRTRGLLPTVADEVPYVARFLATAMDAGVPVCDQARQIEWMNKLWKHVVAYCATPAAPKRLVRSLDPVPVVAGQAPAIPRVPRPGFGPRGTGPKVAGLYVPNGAMAILYNALQDGQEYQVADLQKLVTAEVTGRLRALYEHGKKFGKWSLAFHGKKAVQMTVTQP